VSQPSFRDLGVPAPLVARLAARGISEPTPIQARALPDALAGHDICGRAPTGSGKTLAFGLALAHRVKPGRPRRPRALVLVPTRELASQVQQELASLIKGGGQQVVAVYGGIGYGAQRKALNKGAAVVVACPGRLEDLVSQHDVELSDVDLVVIDEADRMSDMGFLPAVRRLLDRTSAERQTMLFSATLDNQVATVVRDYQHDPRRHDVVEDSAPADVTHHFWHADRPAKVRLTAELVERHGSAIVFCRTRRGADRVTRQLIDAGVRAVAIHGSRSQPQRQRALSQFVAGQATALVATDVAARGIHVDAIGCVVHFDPPGDAKDYVHRSGRTARAGAVGTVVSLVATEEQPAVRALQRQLGFEPLAGSATNAKSAAAPRPRRAGGGRVRARGRAPAGRSR
jgi:superfamily II DNA/RNA helicase